MNMPDEYDLRARYRELLDTDRAEAPDFATMWRRASLPARPSPRRRALLGGGLAIAAAVVIELGLATPWSTVRTLRRPAAKGTGDARAESILTWRSPTASLLRTAGAELFASPSVHTSVLDGITTTRPRPGVAQ
jgi:hypothetical protein